MFHSRSIAWIVWIIGSIFYAYQYLLRVMPSVMMDNILEQFHIDAATFGQYAGVYYIGYSLFHMPIGIMLDRYGPKKVLPICMLLTVLGLLPMLFSTYWLYPIAGRFIMGIGSSAAILGTFKIIRMAFNEEKFTRMLSFSVTIGLMGAIYGGAPLSYMCATIGYKAVIGIFVVIGLLLSALTYIIVPNLAPQKSHSAISDIKEVFSNFKVISLCCFAGLMVGSLEGYADVWATPFLKTVYHFDDITAASLPSLIFVGMCFGAPILSFIAEKTKNYLGTIMGSGILMAIIFFLLLTGKLPIASMSILSVVVGVCCAYQIIAIYQASTYVKEHIVGLTTAVANMIIMLFGYFFHTAIGCVVQKTNLTYGIAIIPVAMMIAIFGIGGIILSERIQK